MSGNNTTYALETEGISLELGPNMSVRLPEIRLPEVSVERKIWFYGYLIFMPIGLFLNLTSIVVFLIMKEYRKSLGLYMIFLALADSMLISGLCLWNINGMALTHKTIPNMIGMSKIFCMLSATLITQTGSVCSSTFLAAISVERFLIVAFPLKMKVWNLRLVAMVVIFAGFVIAFLSSISIFFALEIRQGLEMCAVKAGKRYHYINTIHILNAFNSCNTMIMIIFTILLCIVLSKSRKMRSDMTQSTPGSDKEFKVSVMVVTVTSLFVLTRTPHLIISILLQEETQKGNIHTKFYKFGMKYYPFGDLFLLVNHSVNFFIYFGFLEKFRNVLLRCRCSSASTPRVRAKQDLPSISSKATELTVQSTDM